MMRHDQPVHVARYTILIYFEGIDVPVHGLIHCCFQARELFTNMGAEDQRRVLLAAQFLFWGLRQRCQKPRTIKSHTCDTL